MGQGHALSEDELIKRAALTVDGLGSAGLLTPEQATEFIQIAQDATPVLQMARVEPMSSHTKKLPRVAFPGRLLGASPGDNTSVADADAYAPDFSEVVLGTVELVGSMPVPDSVLEDNVEREKLARTLMVGAAQRIGLDIEDLAINGDTAGSGYYAQINGWLKLITGHVVDASGAQINDALFSAAHDAVPLKYRQSKGAAFNWFTHDHVASKWRDTLGARGTPLGDKYAVSDEIPNAKGKPVLAVANILAAGSPLKTTALFTAPKNLIVGFHREIRVEAFREPPKRRTVFTFSVRVGFAVEQQDAASKIINLAAV